MILPLAGTRVLEAFSPTAPLALRLAGGLAGRIAADLGAEVIRLVRPGEELMAEKRSGRERALALDAFLHAGKSSAWPGQAMAADVCIHDDATKGPGDAPVRAVLSMISPEVSGLPSSEFTIMALGGLLDIVGDPAREPLKLGGHQAAYSAGLSAFAGIAAALCRPREAGAPARETIRVSLLETVVWLNWKSIPPVAGFGPPPARSGAAAEWQVLACADGWVALVYQENDWTNLRTLIGDTRLDAPQFMTRANRLSQLAEIAAIIETAFARLTRREIHARALALRLPLGPVWSTTELMDDPHYRARGFPFADPSGTGARIIALPVLWDGVRPCPAGAASSVSAA